MDFNYSRLKGRIVEICGTQAQFSKEIGISEHTISMKMSGKRGWKHDEISRVCSVLGIPYTDIPIYFFAPKVQKVEQQESGGPA